jgi:flagellar L-ring protein FlgH
MRRRNNKCISVLLLIAMWMAWHAEGGSLYNSDDYRALVNDNRAKERGDSVVVLVYESAVATNSASTKTNKSAELGISATDNHNSIGGKLNNSSDTEGGGVERRSGQIVAKVSATVIDVLSSGELVIKGRQQISLNSEAQTIQVEGRVRPIDIDTNNTILSTRMANAKIEFIGQGLLSAREKPGIFTRIFHWFF